jgi:uncharacterized repeat protein (TIGR03803 family)
MNLRMLAPIPALLLACSIATPSNASYAFQTLFSFCAGPDCMPGEYPNALTRDDSGNFYGTTHDGATRGTVFELVFNARKGTWKPHTLWSFCTQADCKDGSMPTGRLTVDQAGNIYGTTENGGRNPDAGTVFELTPNARHTQWKLHTLHAFCKRGGKRCPDGADPRTGLTYEGASTGVPYNGIAPLYGTTHGGGKGGAGVVFQLAPVAGESKWSESVIHDFCSQADCADGANPAGEPLMDAVGTLFDTTSEGGANGDGTIFQLTFDAGSGQWQETVLHSFCDLPYCEDGDGIAASGLLLDQSGNLYGATPSGGATGYGEVYRLVPNGAQSQLTVLHSFCQQQNCFDGSMPWGPLAMDASGNLFGTTFFGGDNFRGSAFMLAPGDPQYQFIVLYSFCPEQGCLDGSDPQSGMVLDSSGDLIGTTLYGGGGQNGAVFELSPQGARHAARSR